MACVNPDGTLTGSAQAILAALRTVGTAEQIAGVAGLPIFRVRSALRELVEAGLVAHDAADGRHRLTGPGEERLEAVGPVATILG